MKRKTLKEGQHHFNNNTVQEAGYEIIARAYFDYFNEEVEVKVIDDYIIVNDFALDVRTYFKSWKTVCFFEKIIANDKIYNLDLRFTAEQVKIVNDLLTSLGKPTLQERKTKHYEKV